MSWIHRTLIGMLASTTVLLTVASAQPVRIRAMGYPRVAQEARVEGDVLVVCKTDETGRVIDVRGRSGNPVLLQNVISCVRDWAFTPTGRETEYELLFKFRIRGSCAGNRCREDFWFEYPNVAEIVGQAMPLNPGHIIYER